MAEFLQIKDLADAGDQFLLVVRDVYQAGRPPAADALHQGKDHVPV
jgi:hypothetical protein